MNYFFAKHGDGSLFHNWFDEWLTLSEEFPQLFALVRYHETMVRDCREGTWILERVLSDHG